MKSFIVVIKMYSYRRSRPSEKCFRARRLARREACGEKTVVETFISKPHKQAIKRHCLNYSNVCVFSLSFLFFFVKKNTILNAVLKGNSKMSRFSGPLLLLALIISNIANEKLAQDVCRNSICACDQILYTQRHHSALLEMFCVTLKPH